MTSQQSGTGRSRTGQSRTGQSSTGQSSTGQSRTGHTITLLSRPGCHLCDEARAIIARVAADLGISWTERDITESADDLLEYGDMIPVTLIDGVQHDFWRVDERRLRHALR